MKEQPDHPFTKVVERRGLPVDEYNILTDPNLFDTITKTEFDKTIEGEYKSRRAIFLSLCSIWVEDSDIPINTLVSSESSAGKSFICKKIIKIFPKHLVQYRTKITPEAFTYWHNEEGWNWNGKICYLEDISQSILDSSSFKVMCSEGSIATIVRKQKAVDIEIRGKPVMLLTTASTNPKAEILGRFQIVSLDESANQTKAITLRQAKNAEQEIEEKYNEKIVEALRSLERKKVIIPYATKIHQFLKENYNFKSIRLRRDFSRLLYLIKSSAVLYQWQRREKEDKIIATEQDYKIARECINYIQTQTFKGLTHKLKKAWDYCKELKEFTAKEIHSAYPFVNQSSWYRYIDDLCERNLLKPIEKEIEGLKKDGKTPYKVRVTYFSIIKNISFELPEFKNLPETITNDIIDTNDINDINDTNDKKDSNDYNDSFEKEQIKTTKIS